MRLDHLLSHLLRGVVQVAAEHVVFFGGTALCRTHLNTPPWTRVSEDIDLFVTGDASAVELIERQLPKRLRREYPEASWVVAPTSVRPPAAAILSNGRSAVRVQLLPAVGGPWAAWRHIPVERRRVDLRYADTPGHVEMIVPTLAGFTAMKLLAWEDRAAPRDLFDLAGLTTLSGFDPPTASIFRRLTARLPDRRAYQVVPEVARSTWTDQLAHQTPFVPDAAECLRSVAAAVDNLLAVGDA